MKSRGWMATFAALLIYVLCLQPAAAENDRYPEGPVRVLVGFPPGSGPDLVARALAAGLSDSFGQPFVVENRVGARGNLALEAVARSEPNGYTLLMATSAQMTINPALSAEMRVDPLKDLAPITLATSNALLLLASPAFAPNSVRELIDLLKSNPGKTTYASAGIGSEHHLAAELFSRLAGVSMLHVAYRGFPPAITDLMAGNVDIAFGGVPPAASLVKAGKLKALAITSGRRYPGLPDVPTFAESGISGYEVYAWYGLLAAKGTPSAIINKLQDTALKVLRSPDAAQRYALMGMDVIAQGPEEFSERMKSETRIWAQTVQAAGIKIQ